MIRIERERLDETGAPVQPDAAWWAAAASATARALGEREQHRVDRTVYRDPSLCAALEKLFHDKCAYCETRITGGSEWDVEHFRPKGAVAERADHGGYYWLAYTWTNLYPSCKLCNQRRRDPPRWGDPRWGKSRGKLDHFPLVDESVRAMRPEDPIESEQPLLLDPCADFPELHLGVTLRGEPFSIGSSPRGEASIELFHLKRKRLCDLRKRKIVEAVRIQELVQKYREGGRDDVCRDFQRLLDGMTEDGHEYAATVRAVLRDPDAFGL